MPSKKKRATIMVPARKRFMWEEVPVPKPRKPPVRLLVEGERCGCTFRYATGFRIRCEFHKTQFEAIREMHRNFKIMVAWPKQKPRKRVKPRVDSAEFVDAFRAEIARRTEIQRVERAKLIKPTRKLTKKQREHLHTFAFTAEQVRAELLAAK